MMYTPNIIPNKDTEKVQSDEKQPGKSKVLLSVILLWV